MSARTELFGNRHVVLWIWWACEVVRRACGGIELMPERGCRRVVIRRSDHRHLLDYRSPRAICAATVGDAFMCCGAELADTLGCHVVAVDPVGALSVRFWTPLSPRCDRLRITRMCAAYTSPEQAAQQVGAR